MNYTTTNWKIVEGCLEELVYYHTSTDVDNLLEAQPLLLTKPDICDGHSTPCEISKYLVSFKLASNVREYLFELNETTKVVPDPSSARQVIQMPTKRPTSPWLSTDDPALWCDGPSTKKRKLDDPIANESCTYNAESNQH